MMGSDDGEEYEKPVHRVTVSDFFIAKTEVTQALWKAVMGNNPSEFKGDYLPVEQVSWNDAIKFIKKLNRITGRKYRLPTEAEWEYAAGGGSEDRTKWVGTNEETSVEDYAWYKSNSGGKTHIVTFKMPNSLGLFDMSGNVCEWCMDSFDKYSSDDQTNPTGPSSGSYRMFRGGGWSTIQESCRTSNRMYNDADLRNHFIGFRLALVP